MRDLHFDFKDYAGIILSFESVLKAKEKAVCIECACVIHQSDLYVHEEGYFATELNEDGSIPSDAKPRVFKTCITCAEIRGKICTYTHSRLFEDLEEAYLCVPFSDSFFEGLSEEAIKKLNGFNLKKEKNQMSGGHFDGAEYHIKDIADTIEKEVLSNGERDYPFSDEAIIKFKQTVAILRLAHVMAHRFDWLISCGDSETTYFDRLKNDIAELQRDEQKSPDTKKQNIYDVVLGCMRKGSD